MNSVEVKNFQDSINKVTVAFADAVKPLGEAVIKFADIVHAHVKTEYEKAGKPYGEDGMMRWFEEVCEAERLEWRAADIRERRFILSEMRKPLNLCKF